MSLPHLTGELDHVPRQPDEPDPAAPITTAVHPPQPASHVGHPTTPGVKPRNLPSPVSRPQRLIVRCISLKKRPECSFLQKITKIGTDDL